MLFGCKERATLSKRHNLSDPPTPPKRRKLESEEVTTPRFYDPAPPPDSPTPKAPPKWKIKTKNIMLGMELDTEMRLRGAIEQNQEDFYDELSKHFDALHVSLVQLINMDEYFECTLTGQGRYLRNAMIKSGKIGTSFGVIYTMDGRYRRNALNFRGMTLEPKTIFIGDSLMDWAREIIPAKYPIAPICVITVTKEWFCKFGKTKTVEWRWKRPILPTKAMEQDSHLGYAIIMEKNTNCGLLIAKIAEYIPVRRKDHIMNTNGNGFDSLTDLDQFLKLYANAQDPTDSNLLRKDLIGIKFDTIEKLDDRLWSWDLSLAKKIDRNPCFHLAHAHWKARRIQLT